jgi:threonine dehydrogenase-like Zn-dependent dehydrogenase
MRALQLRELGRLDEVELPVPSPEREEVLIKTMATTICTSDLTDISHNPFGTELPKVLGHEGAGIVAGVGEGITDFRVGDRVAAHPVIPCGDCAQCRRGLGHLCDRMGHLGIDRNGTFAEFFTMPARRVRKLPGGLDFAVGALVEPVAVCLEAVRRARVDRSAGSPTCARHPAEPESLLVLGDGPFGIIIGRLALRCGPVKLVIVGRHDFRLGQVPEAVTINEKRTPDAAAAVLAATDGRGVDAAILAAPSPTGVQVCLRSLRARGRLVVFSGIVDPTPVDLFRLHVKELEILGACNDQDYLDEALALLSDPALKLDAIITHRVPFAEWPRAIELASRRKDEALKVAIVFGEAGPRARPRGS